jgi:hypothetical protein
MASGSMGREEDDTVTGVVGLTNVPDAIRCRDPLVDPDYVDLFTATTSEATSRSAEEWARVALEETPTGRSAPLVWRRLGFARLCPGLENRCSRRRLDQARDGFMVHDCSRRHPGR